MANDPAVLFFISDWLTATKGMKAEAKGWFLNLILFQYELGSLPNDMEELANLCDVRFSEFNKFEQVFEQVLKHKFNKNKDGRLENERAKTIIQNRKTFKNKRSNAGKYSYLATFLKKHFKLKVKEKQFIKARIDLDSFDLKNEQVFKQMIEHLLQLYINENGNGNTYKDEIKSIIPDYEIFKNYAISKSNDVDLIKLKSKYESWKENDWKDGYHQPIKNWKSKILGTLPYLNSTNNKPNESLPTKSFHSNR